MSGVHTRIGELTFCDPLVTGAWQLESTTILPSSVTKPSNYNNLRILLVYSRHTDACPGVIYVRPTVNLVSVDKHGCSSVLMLRPSQGGVL